MKLARDGIQLSFDVAGTGSPQFLFVHGLGGDRTHFAPQMEYFARQGRALNMAAPYVALIHFTMHHPFGHCPSWAAHEADAIFHDSSKRKNGDQ